MNRKISHNTRGPRKTEDFYTTYKIYLFTKLSMMLRRCKDTGTKSLHRNWPSGNGSFFFGSYVGW